MAEGKRLDIKGSETEGRLSRIPTGEGEFNHFRTADPGLINCTDAEHSQTLNPSDDDSECAISQSRVLNQHGQPGLVLTRTPTKTTVSFHSTDAEHPNNWRKSRKLLVFVGGIATVVNSTLGSSIPSGAITYIAADFNITSNLKLVLPISIYLVGYVVGPIVCGPLSETFGRRPVMLYSFLVYIVFTLGCALAPTFACLIFFRWICGIMASAPIAVVGGLYADIYPDPRERGSAMAYFMAATTFGPTMGPLLSGFISHVSWRWAFWLALIIAVTTLPVLVFLPETYVPVLLKQKAAQMRKETGQGSMPIYAQSELDKKTVRYMVTVVLYRPIKMLVYESIVLFTCMYLSLAYAIFYLYFEAYPMIFQGPNSIYKFSSGVAGLAFLPIGIGAFSTAFIFLWYNDFFAKGQKTQKNWAQIEEYRRLPLACIGGPLYVISLFWLGWSAYSNVHWIVPMLSGVPFGMGFLLIFMA